MNGYKNVVHTTMEYYSALRRKKTLLNATTWMNLVNVTLSEIS
jgi:hypothetical protein